MNTLARIALRWAKCVLRFALRAAESPFRPSLHECSKYIVFSLDLAEAEPPGFKFRDLNLLPGHQDSTHLEDSRGWKGLPKLFFYKAGFQRNRLKLLARRCAGIDVASPDSSHSVCLSVRPSVRPSVSLWGGGVGKQTITTTWACLIQTGPGWWL